MAEHFSAQLADPVFERNEPLAYVDFPLAASGLPLILGSERSLEAVACECYEVVRAEGERLLSH